MRLSLANDSFERQTDSYVARFQEQRVYERLRAIDVLARSEGPAALDPVDPLVRIGTETDASGRVIKNGYGVSHLPWRAQDHPEWPSQVAAEVEELRAAIRAAHNVPLRFLIWAGMGGSAEDKAMYRTAGLLRRGPRCYVLDSADPAKLQNIIADIQSRHGLSIGSILRSTLVVAMAMGMTSYEPVVNLEKLSNLYERCRIDSRPNLLYMTLPGSLRYDRLCFDPGVDGASAPEIYACILRRLVAERRAGELTFFGDTRYSPAGTAVRKRLEHAAGRLFCERLHMHADVYGGPAMKHSYHEMIIGHGRCFSTILISASAGQYAAARYSPDYNPAQFLATQMALAERGHPVVSVTLKNVEEEGLRALEDFFHRAAQALETRAA